MPSTLIFPDGIRLARRDEIPGPEPLRSETWARVECACIESGYVLHAADDARFTHYAEINVDAPQIWAVFRDLCQALLGPDATLIVGEADREPVPVGSADVLSVIATLEPHQYQLAHDGFLQYGLVSDRDGKINEVLVAPEKHFKVWMTDEKSFRQIMERNDIRGTDHVEFLDEYPRTAVALSPNTIAFHSHTDLISHLEKEIAAISKRGK
jgi:hypothetical protein